MKDKGYCGVGVINMKTSHNFGSLFRTAQIMDADFIFCIGKRFTPQASDTMCSYKHLPIFSYDSFDDFQNHRPHACPLICIELAEEAVFLHEFDHPKTAMYLLGAEDSGIPKSVLDKAQHIVKLYGERSMNVAVAGSIVLYDRKVRLDTPLHNSCFQ